MRKLSFQFIGLFLITSLLIVGCRQNKKTGIKTPTVEKVAVDEFKVLATYLESNGDFINSDYVPAMIATKEVFENKGNAKYKIIDLRKKEDYAAGHIENAVNVPSKNMLDYFENTLTPRDYEKIAFVCYSGQSASYTTGIMRLLGYDNVFAMKFGMSSWNKDLAKSKWSKNITNDYADKLEKTANAKANKGAYPVLKTGKTKAINILEERAKIALAIPYKTLLVKAPALFENPSNYYTVNYWPEKKYNMGHVPGAVQYTPKKSLGTASELATLPIDKEIVTYCYTGQHAAFVTAYLQVLGYNAKALAYGANSFMNGVMKEKGKKWHPFSAKKIGTYELVNELEMVH